jgi:hypothetical protein
VEAMTERERLQIDETKRRIFGRDGYRCLYLGCTDNSGHVEIAHGVGQGKRNVHMIRKLWYQMYGEIIANVDAEKIIHDDDNLFTSCQKHNSYFDYSFNRERVKAFLKAYHDNKISTEGEPCQ